MKHIIPLLVTVLFFIWILPLGAFIKLKDEEKACNGQRAICLCSHLIAKQMAKTAGKQLLKSGTGSSHKQAGSPSFGPDFILNRFTFDVLTDKNAYRHPASQDLTFCYTRPIEHIPKA